MSIVRATINFSYSEKELDITEEGMKKLGLVENKIRNYCKIKLKLDKSDIKYGKVSSIKNNFKPFELDNVIELIQEILSNNEDYDTKLLNLIDLKKITMYKNSMILNRLNEYKRNFIYYTKTNDIDIDKLEGSLSDLIKTYEYDIYDEYIELMLYIKSIENILNFLDVNYTKINHLLCIDNNLFCSILSLLQRIIDNIKKSDYISYNELLYSEEYYNYIELSKKINNSLYISESNFYTENFLSNEDIYIFLRNNRKLVGVTGTDKKIYEYYKV